MLTFRKYNKVRSPNTHVGCHSHLPAFMTVHSLTSTTWSHCPSFSWNISGKLCTLLFLENVLRWNTCMLLSFGSLSQFYLAFKAQFKCLLFHESSNSPFPLFVYHAFPWHCILPYNAREWPDHYYKKTKLLQTTVKRINERGKNQENSSEHQCNAIN